MAQQPFEVPAACGSREEFASEVARLLGAEARGSSLPKELTIERTEPAAEYRLRLLLGDERRELVDPDCRTLFRSAVVISAAAARREVLPATETAPTPTGVNAVVETPAGSAGNSPAAAKVEAAAPRVGVPASGKTPRASAASGPPPSELSAPKHVESATRVRFGVGLGAAVGIGTVPGLGPSVELDGRLLAGMVSAKLAASYWFATRRERDGRGVRIDALALRAAGALDLTSYLNVALGVGVDRWVGSGRSVGASSTEAVWDVLPFLEVSVIPVKFSHFRLEVGVRGQLSTTRPRFVVVGFGDIYRVPLLGGEATIRVVFQTP